MSAPSGHWYSSVTEEAIHRLTKLAIVGDTVIAALDVPEDLRVSLYMKDQYICLLYGDLEQYYMKPTQPINLTDSLKPQNCPLTSITPVPASTFDPQDRPNFLIDISSHTPARPGLPSLSILPYIRLYFTMRHVRFHFLTFNDAQGKALTEIASTVLHRYSSAWRKMVLETGNVKDVRIWWKEKCIDIVVWPTSQWAVDWHCCDDGAHAMALKNALGLMGTENMRWKGTVVVAGVEAEGV